MGREETVLAATIAVDNVDKGANLRIVGWAPTGHKGFHDTIIDSSCQKIAYRYPTQQEKQSAEVIVILNYQIEHRQVKRYPRKTIGKRAHNTVEIQRIAAVDSQQQLAIDIL
jgi:hypothetical protein